MAANTKKLSQWLLLIRDDVKSWEVATLKSYIENSYTSDDNDIEDLYDVIQLTLLLSTYWTKETSKKAFLMKSYVGTGQENSQEEI